MKGMLQYSYNLLVLGSQFISTLLGGDPDTSISQRVGKAYLAHSEKYTIKTRLFKLLKNSIDLLFYNCLWKIEKNHCLNSLQGEKNTKVLWDWSK